MYAVQYIREITNLPLIWILFVASYDEHISYKLIDDQTPTDSDFNNKDKLQPQSTPLISQHENCLMSLWLLFSIRALLFFHCTGAHHSTGHQLPFGTSACAWSHTMYTDMLTSSSLVLFSFCGEFISCSWCWRKERWANIHCDYPSFGDCEIANPVNY